MIFELVLLAMAGEWSIHASRDRCVFFADATSSVQDQVFAENSAYFPDNALREPRCRFWSLRLAEFGFDPLTTEPDTPILRAVRTRAFTETIAFDVRWNGSSETATLRQAIGVGPDARHNEQELDRETASRLLQHSIWAVCAEGTDTSSPGGADGDSWLVEFAETERYCLVEEWGPRSPLMWQLTNILNNASIAD